MTVERLADLREPPVVGRVYLVPVVPYIWLNMMDDWPVLGPMHDDKEFFKFDQLHYHVDMRFIPAARARRVAHHISWRSHVYDRPFGEKLAFAATGWPLARLNEPLPKGRPVEKPMKCVRKWAQPPLLDADGKPFKAMVQMQAHFGDPAKPIRRADGRILCPHRKVDLSQFPPDRDGIVTCPLHGLRVQCGRPNLELTP